VQKEKVTPFCPLFHHALEILGRRWTAVVIRAIMGGNYRFSDIRQAIPGLSDRLLSQRLKELETEGIVNRVVRTGHPITVEYTLTGKGEALATIVKEVSHWAEDWLG
jgi:DNA-binding HxlR family transcriptional regulator